MYKIAISEIPFLNDPVYRSIKRLTDGAFFPISLENSDYHQFKLDLADGVELQDADGNTMTAEEVAEFLATLP